MLDRALVCCKCAGMEITNFRENTRDGYDGDWIFAEVDITTGYLWWKRTKSVEVVRDKYSTCWRFVDSGEYTPGFRVESLYGRYCFKRQLDKQG